MSTESSDLDDYMDDEDLFGCEHYRRRCLSVAPCCNIAFPCRLCHDDDMYFKRPHDGHKIDRFAIKRIICNECDTEQNVSNECIKCKIQFAVYFCKICNLFTDPGERHIYHCDKCGICRISDNDDMEHCDTCNACCVKDHVCMVSKNDDCTLCMCDLFSSTTQRMVLDCGHGFHVSCINEYLKSDYRCPTCRKLMITDDVLTDMIEGHMAVNNGGIIPNAPDVNVLCYQCGKMNDDKFNAVANKCKDCGSYNTTCEEKN